METGQVFQKFYGLMTLREGIEKSRNLMTWHVWPRKWEWIKFPLLQKPALIKSAEIVVDVVRRRRNTADGFDRRLCGNVNGGKKVTPYLIERIQDRYGRTILKQDDRICDQLQS